ncbi:unnamed protein product [Phytophthora lilii]|uniref:Unnamed protein product n=1 Tax=Phytophthora lilii TaxID=2077276 RepID=A0A9W6UBF8_9STRA|nr:unnamed protein product [Phytophthora lilii]
MASLLLSQLKDALTALGVSTATGNLKGEARRDELVKRLHHARVASGNAGLLTAGETEEFSEDLKHLSLSELRSALELRQISTQTPGLKGDARRHALIQRLMNSYSNEKDPTESDNYFFRSCDDQTNCEGSLGDENEDDTKSETSSSAYSTATEFIFYDTSKSSAVTELEMKLTQPRKLSFTKIRNEYELRGQPTTQATELDTDRLLEDLFELRTKLHTGRQERQLQAETLLKKAGIVTTLSEISAKLQILERERRRLQDNYFAHELITSDLLSLDGSNQVLEFIQEDAILLIEKRQAALKQTADKTKEAMALAKFHILESERSMPKSVEISEDDVIQQIQRIESSLVTAPVKISASSLHESCKPSLHSGNGCSATVIPGLARSESMPNCIKASTWDEMHVQERKQLHRELHTAASFHIRRDRMPLTIPDKLAMRAYSARAPSLADTLGIKARYMEKARRNRKEIDQTYKQALELDKNHADNLGSYALFLCKTSNDTEQAYTYFQQALRADPVHAKNITNYANFVLRKQGNIKESEVYFKLALEIAPSDVNILGGYADLLSSKPREAGENLLLAREVLEKALDISPSHQTNRLRLALVLADLNEYTLAENCFEELIRFQDNDCNEEQAKSSDSVVDSSLVSIYECYAKFLHQRGQWQRAKRLYNQALVIDPQRPSLLRSL